MSSIKVFIKDLKIGHGVNHPKHGYMQYRGLVKISPYSDRPAVPHKYLFWMPADEQGRILDKVLKNGLTLVEVVDYNNEDC